jgi:hypothetical protein
MFEHYIMLQKRKENANYEYPNATSSFDVVNNVVVRDRDGQHPISEATVDGPAD